MSQAMNNHADEAELLRLTHKLLDAVVNHDWPTYASLCDENLTCFEPEARGQCVTGLEFHKFYFDLPAGSGPRHTTLCDVHVRILGDAALVTYVRLTQRLDANGRPATSAIEETRVWQRSGGAWKHVHFHRSAPQ